MKKPIIFSKILLGFTLQASAVQVLYPQVPDLNTHVYVPHESAHVAIFDHPQAPIMGPTIPSNAAHGLEHRSAYVIPDPRIITHARMGTLPMITTTVTGGVNEVPVVSTQTFAGNSVVGPHPHTHEPHPRGAFTRFITTVPVTSFSDELPVTVIITVNS